MDNTCVNFDENAVVLKENDYYPFGMRHYNIYEDALIKDANQKYNIPVNLFQNQFTSKRQETLYFIIFAFVITNCAVYMEFL